MLDRIETALNAVLDWGAVSGLRRAVLILALGLAVLIPGLAAMPVTDRDEARFAQASKQMLETGDLIDIRFQDAPRWKKPVGIYWLQAGAASAFGATEAPIWAYRLPSVLGALIAAWLTAWAARALVTPRLAVLAGLMMTVPLLMVAEGHIAKTDAALAATATAVLGALAHTAIGRGGPGVAAVFWLGLAFAILIKGPIVPVIAASTLTALAWRQQTRQHLRQLYPLPGLAVTALIVLPWLIAIWQISDGAFFQESLGKDMAAKVAAGQEKHWGPPGLYLGLVWATFWPWAALLPLAAGVLWRLRGSVAGVLVIAWVVPFWLILELVPTKLPHYVLPLYPALVLGIVAWLNTIPDHQSGRLSKISAVLIAGPGLVIALGILAVPLLIGSGIIPGTGDDSVLPSRISWPGVILAAVAAMCIWLATRAAWSGRITAQIGASLLAAATLYPAILQFSLPALGTGFPSPVLSQLHAQYRACASGPGFSIGYHEPSFVFLTETKIRFADPGAAITALTEDPGAMVFITDRWAEILTNLPEAEERAHLRHFNYNRGKMERIVLLTPDDPRWDACAG
ncbi:MAG: glycosyltransferase family 39 protein [Pseudomonadota bacterium]